MALHSFRLRVASPVRSINLRELNGHDELMLEETGAIGAIKLLTNLTVQPAYTNETVSIAKIAIADRDYLLSGIYKYTYGSQIDSTLRCQACKQPYDVSFSLDGLVEHIRSGALAVQTDDDGFYKLDDNCRFRLPTGEDELAVWGLTAAEAGPVMLQRCLPQPVSDEKTSEIEQIMEKIAPILSTDIGVNCPECGNTQNVKFDMQSFLLGKMKNERKRVASEVHRIASAYKWSHQEIMDLPRSLRQTYSNLIDPQ